MGNGIGFCMPEDIDIAAKVNQATEQFTRGELERAQDTCDEVLLAVPRQFDALYLTALIAQRRGRIEEALELIGAALSVNPASYGALNTRGKLLWSLRRFEEALASYAQALSIKPDYAEALFARSLALQELGRYEAALASYDQALQVRPNYAPTLNNRGNVLLALGRPQEALADIERSLQARPRHAQTWNNQGNVLRRLGRPLDAIAAYDRALGLMPKFVEALSNRGAALQDLQRIPEALASYDDALTIAPDYAEAQWNKSLACLLSGNFTQGWPLYEARWHKQPQLAARYARLPRWTGSEPVAGKTLLLHSEQGLGDTIQFCRYAKLVAERGARVLLQVQDALTALLRNLEGVAVVYPQQKAAPRADYQASLLSLPLAFHTQLQDIPCSTPYLHARRDLIERWQRWLPYTSQPRIGLAWSGSATHVRDHDRSLALETLAPLLGQAAQFISLQQTVRDSDLPVLQRHTSVVRVEERLHDFSDTAALIACCDLVISVDTAVAHLAGALGKPVWILLPFAPDWRWLLEREDSPWYPSARLFRQQTFGDWAGVVERVERALID